MARRSIVSWSFQCCRAVLRYRQFSPLFIVRSHSTSPLSQPSTKHFDLLSRLNHKDRLAPNEVLQIFQTLKNPKLILDVLNKLAKRKNYRPHEALYTIVIQNISGCQKCFEFFEKMEKAGVDPDAITFNIIISGLRKEGRFEEAVNLFNKMGHKGCDPSRGTHQEELHALLDVEIEKFSEAKCILDRMVSMGLNPSFVSYKLIIHGLCGLRQMGDVEIVLRQMVPLG
ncbi:Pentatricopeptide repeat [Dillenia turbinata]|uniref:Pentatricopeptide repeat n=1 Tax=Dillenia turbinata TaxID=194707 RepID=A0AAN8VH40_9MAGN